MGGFLDAFAPNQLTLLAADPVVWVALATLIAMEVVLGIDNLIFISIVTNRLPPGQRERARRIGIGLALILRILLLATVAFIVKLTAPVLSVFGQAFSWRDLILIAGGLFLLWKATKEIHHRVDVDHAPDLFDRGASALTFGAVVGQIILLDIVFSVDSIITAVGMTPHIPVMVIAVIVAVAVMMLAVNPLAEFINANPTVVMLALGFLIMIGMTLIADGFGAHVPRGYIYTAMAFSTAVEGLNLLSRRAERKRRRQSERAS
jgi:predicted tellurium resistance membrane protein TerC